MQYYIKREPQGTTLPFVADRRIVYDDYAGTPKLFPTREIAMSYAKLSLFKSVSIEGTR